MDYETTKPSHTVFILSHGNRILLDINYNRSLTPN